jgi:hypothetical protein
MTRHYIEACIDDFVKGCQVSYSACTAEMKYKSCQSKYSNIFTGLEDL